MSDTASARLPRTPAQHYCRVVGVVLLLAGLIGFVAEGSFSSGDTLERGSLLGLDVNGWHNLVHVASGLLLLAAANTRPTAKTVAIGVGFTYALVTLWGLIDGEDILGVIPVNGPDNVLHLVLAAAGIALGMMSPTTGRAQRRRLDRDGEPAPTERS